jgi:hypothetical protein
LRIKKAVITAAGQNQRALPLQTLIDRNHRATMLIPRPVDQWSGGH